MSSDVAIRIKDLGKCYQIYNSPRDRLLQMLVRGRKQLYREFWALQDISLELKQGECLGIVGRNGAGKSTLLQLLCGTLTPTIGEITVKGRVAALLELGAGFNPEFTGRENVLLSAAVMGLSREEIEANYEEIVDFSGIRDFIDQPVKTYSSGMYVRLAFAVATSINPDVLVIDEALSVGDGDFSRKSFERIMAMRDEGKTILFCSHAVYQIEALCSQAIWIERGKIEAAGRPDDVVTAYNSFLESLEKCDEQESYVQADLGGGSSQEARITNVNIQVSGGSYSKFVRVRSAVDDLSICIDFNVSMRLASPNIGVVLVTNSGRNICSAGSHIDKIPMQRDASGRGQVTLTFPKIPLLKGEYWVDVFLLCERGIHVYEHAARTAKVTVLRNDLEVGVVSLPRSWKSGE